MASVHDCYGRGADDGMGRGTAHSQRKDRCDLDRERRDLRLPAARLMRELGIRSVTRRRFRTGTTKRGPKARPAPDLVNRDFNGQGPAPGLGARHHASAHRHGLAVPRRGARCVEPEDRRLGDGAPDVGRSGRRRVVDGDHPPPTEGPGRAPPRPGRAVHVAGVRKALPRQGAEPSASSRASTTPAGAGSSPRRNTCRARATPSLPEKGVGERGLRNAPSVPTIDSMLYKSHLSESDRRSGLLGCSLMTSRRPSPSMPVDHLRDLALSRTLWPQRGMDEWNPGYQKL